MKILILGSTGMLGNAVAKYFFTTNHEIYTTFRNESMKYNNNSFFYNPTIHGLDALKGFDYIINCIGVIKPFVTKDTMQNTIFLNSVFPRELASFCNQEGTRLIHITTDCVFSGRDGLYDENSPHDCLDAYGKSKSLGEPENCMVLRTSIIGNEIHKDASLISWVKSNAGKEINGFTNHLWNGVTTYQYGKICHQIIEKNLYKNDLYHVFSEDISKYELVSLINEYFNLNIKINKVVAKDTIDRTLRTIKDLNNKLQICSLSDQIKQISQGE